ncbi:hypothetical protein Tco_1163241 [Tanacetum coccineum]
MEILLVSTSNNTIVGTSKYGESNAIFAYKSVSRKHFKTLSLDELRSLDFNLFSDQENSEEEVAETIAETMKQYMSKTRAEYGSGVARPKIEDKDNFELKGQFLKELRTNTFNSSNHEDANEHIEKILDSRGAISSKTATDAKVAIQEMAIQAQLNNLEREIKKVNKKVYVAQAGCEQCKGPHYTKDCPLKEEGKTLEEAYYTQFGGPFQEGEYRAATPGFYQRNNANPSFQEQRQSMEDTLSKFMSKSEKRHEENSNLIKEIQASTDAAIRNQGASIKSLEIQIRQMSKVLQERGFGSLPSSTKVNPRYHVESISTTIEANSCPIRRIGSSQYVVSTGQNRTLMYETRQTTIPFPSRLNGYHCKEKKGSYGPQFLEAYSEASHINNSIPRKEKDPGSFTLPCFINNVCFDNALVDLGASVSVMPLSTYLNLGLGELAHTKLTVELTDRTVKYPKGIAENVLVGIGEIKVDLMPPIEKGEIIEEFKTRDDELDAEIDDYHSYCDYDKKIHINCAHNLKFSCMIGFEFTHANFFPLLYVNVISKKFYNSIMKDKMEYKGNNVIGALINVPIFVGTFSGEPLITEYLVKISKRRAFWSLNEDILKITILTTNTPYPSRKIRRIRACTHQRPQRKHDQYVVSREDQYAVLDI